ncbi:MAG TPA: Hsp20/alpha crystallin family protein, partial [Terriglobia bacterium]|nr:Hsp20/alpha crystallin family protein [Terriglobia bacterium]
LQISVEPQRLTITGKRETKEEKKAEKTIYQERCSDELMRVIDLPAAVDPDKVKATLENGILALEMPKAAPAKQVTIQPKVA